MQRDWEASPTMIKLMQAFREMHRFSWEDSSIEGCRPSEIRVLFCIRHGMMKVSEISKMLHVTSPSVTQHLKGLEANGLIERKIDSIDRRVVGIKLTERGEEVVRTAWEGFIHSMKGLIAYMGEEECNQLAELLLKMFHYYDEQAAARRSREQEEYERSLNGMEMSKHA